MSLLVSRLATFIQIRKFGPIGSGLLSIQGTSFAFIGVLIAVGQNHIQAGNTVVSALWLIQEFALLFRNTLIVAGCWCLPFLWDWAWRFLLSLLS
jgi:xanthine/uracil permease